MDTRVTVRLAAELLTQVLRLARQRGQSVAAVVREALEAAVGGEARPSGPSGSTGR